MPLKNPDSKRNWGVFYQDDDGNWIADFVSNDDDITDIEEANREAGRGFLCVFLPEHAQIKPFRWAGAISEGTLRPEDLLPKYLEVLDDLGEGSWISYLASTHHGWETIISRIRDDQGMRELNLDDLDPDDVAELIARLADEMHDAAPDGYEFGSHEGDPASIGFWRTDSD